MIVLGIDTALGACSVALVRDGSLLARRFEPMVRGHAERLFPMLNEVCGEARLKLAEVGRIAVTVGPGSFTGTRVGLAAARGIALAAGHQVVGVTTLAAVAAGTQDIPPRALTGVLFDARQGGFYGQIFDSGTEALTDPFVVSAEGLAARVAQLDRGRPLALVGTGAQAGREAIGEWAGGVVVAGGNPLPDAAVVAHLGAGLSPGAAPPEPLYLRPPDAVPASPPAMGQ